MALSSTPLANLVSKKNNATSLYNMQQHKNLNTEKNEYKN
jgi:hypothetical protein